MSLKTLTLGALAAAALAAPVTAMADPGDWHRDDWRAREWRAHEWRELHGYGWRPAYGRVVAYAPHCWVENRGYYNWYGAYVYRPVRVCR